MEYSNRSKVATLALVAVMAYLVWERAPGKATEQGEAANFLVLQIGAFHAEIRWDN